MFQTALSLLREKLEAGAFLECPVMPHLSWGRGWEEGAGLWGMNAMNFLANFDVSTFALTWGTGAFSLVSGSLTKRIGSFINFESVCSRWGGRRNF